MIKIIIESRDEFTSVIKCEVTISEEATTSDALGVFCRILQLEGYEEEAVRSGLEEVEYDLYESIEGAYKVMSDRR